MSCMERSVSLVEENPLSSSRMGYVMFYAKMTVAMAAIIVLLASAYI